MAKTRRLPNTAFQRWLKAEKDLPPSSFSEQGTNVNAAIVVIAAE